MRKILFWLIAFPCISSAGTLTLYQNAGGNLGSISINPGPQIFIGTTTCSGFQTGLGPVQWDLTIANGAHRFLVVGCGAYASDSSTSVILSGNYSLTQATANFVNTTGAGTGLFYYVDPPVGDFGISAYIDSGVKDRSECCAMTLTGVNASPIGSSTGTVNYPSFGVSTTTLTTTVSREVILDVMIDVNPTDTPVPATGQGQVWHSTSAYFVLVGSTRTVNSPATVNMGWQGIQTPHVTTSISIRPSQ